MKIKFKTISIKNFLSYGASPIILDFNKNQFTLIVGDNGSGKSTIIVDGLHFVLFGKIIRKGIKISQVVNNINKKGCEVKLSLDINNIPYIIERGISPDYLYLYKEGEKVETRSSKVLVQKEIDSLLEFDQNTFSNISILSLNNNKSFMDLSPAETRNVIENLLGIQIYSKMLDKAKEYLKENKDKLKIIEKDYSLYDGLLIDSKNRIERVKIYKENFEKEKNDKIKNIKENILNVSNYLIDKKKEVKNIEAPIFPKEVDLIAVELKDIQNIINEINTTITVIKTENVGYEKRKHELKTKFNFFNKTEVCPICDSVLDEEHKKKEIESTENELKEIEIKVKFNLEEIKRWKRINDENDKLFDDKQSNRKKLHDDYIKSHESYINHIKEQEQVKLDIQRELGELKSYKEQLKQIEESSIDYPNDIIDEKILEGYEEKFKILYQDKEKTENEILYYEYIKELLSDEGIKAQIIKNDLPFLNKTIVNYLKDFGCLYTIKFDEQFNIVLGGYSKRGLSYESLSGGERKRLDLSILLSFIDLARMKNSINCNVLIFDELLSTALDHDGKKIIIDVINNKIMKNELENVFIISHDKDLYVDNCNKIEVYKEGEFSKIKYFLEI